MKRNYLRYDNTVSAPIPQQERDQRLPEVAVKACFDGLTSRGVVNTDVEHLVRASLADNTRRAYASDIARFLRWGGTIPATADLVARCLADQSTSYAVASLTRMVAALSKAHTALGLEDPTKHPLVRSIMQGIRRTHGVAQRQARPILRDDLFTMLDRLGARPKDVRDKAILLVGFATALRRSELVTLDAEDIDVTPQGMMITVRRSKTDQEGHGRQIAVPPGRMRYCPVRAMSEWLALASIEEGAIFRGIDKYGHILGNRLSGEAVSYVVKSRLEAVGYDPADFSGHSLRAGFVTAAAMAGAPSHKIRETTGHRSEASLARYIRQVELFHDPAVSRVL